MVGGTCPASVEGASHEGLALERLFLTPQTLDRSKCPPLGCSFQSLTAQAQATQPSPTLPCCHHTLPTPRAQNNFGQISALPALNSSASKQTAWSILTPAVLFHLK